MFVLILESDYKQQFKINKNGKTAEIENKYIIIIHHNNTSLNIIIIQQA